MPVNGKMPILLHTDGGADNKTRVGGAAYVFHYAGIRHYGYAGYEPATNNTMELTAAIEGLKQVRKTLASAGKQSPVVLLSDSQYVVNGISDWIYGWIKRQWRTAKGEPVANKELWLELHAEVQKFADLRFQWVKGHSGVELNEFVDSLATRGRIERIEGKIGWMRKQE